MPVFDIFFFHTKDAVQMGNERKKKRWLWILAAPVILAGAAMLALKIYLTDERLKALIVPEIEAATHRTVDLEDISFSFFPGLGITVSGFTLSNPPGGEFPNPYLLSLRRLFIDVKLMPLLRRRLEVNNLTLEEPVIYLDVTADGRKNTSAGGGARIVGDAAGRGASPGEGPARLGAFLLSNMEIIDGRIEWFNRKLDSRWIITGLHQTLRLGTDESMNTAALEGESRIREFSYGTGTSWYIENLPLEATEQVAYLLSDDRLEFTDVSILLKDVPLKLAGSVRGIREETAVVDLTVGSPGLTVEHLLSLLPAAMMKGASDVAASGNASFSMKVAGRSNDTLNPGVNASFRISDGTVRYRSLTKSITGVSLDGALVIPEAPVGGKDAGTLELRNISVTLGSNTLTGNLTVTGFGAPAIDGSLRGNIALDEIREYYPLEEGTQLAGIISSDISMNGRPLEPKSIRASGTLKLRDVSYATPGMARPLRHLNGEVTFNNQRLTLKNLTLVLGGSDLRLDATLRNYLSLAMDAGDAKGAKPFLEFALKSKNLNIADIPTDGTDTSARDAGHGRESSAAGTPGGSLLLPGIDMAGTVDIDTLRTEKFTFTGTRGAIAVNDGIARLKDLRLDVFGGSVETSGSLDLGNPARRPFDLSLDVRGVESNSLLSPFTTFGKYLSGKLTLSTKMKGDLDDTLGISTTTLTGAGTAIVADGKLTGLPLLEKLAGFLSADNLREVEFKNWSQSFSVADGKLTVKDLKIGGKDAEITVNGVHGLDGSIDYSLNVRLPESVTAKINPRGVSGELLKFFTDRDGSMSFDFLVSGQSASPVLKLDTRVQENLLKQRLGEEAAKKLSGPLKKAAEGLKKLIKP